MKNGLTASIVIRQETKEKLEECSTSMKDTYDIVISKLIDFWKANHYK